MPNFKSILNGIKYTTHNGGKTWIARPSSRTLREYLYGRGKSKGEAFNDLQNTLKFLKIELN